MLDIKYIRQNPDKVKLACKNRGVEVEIDELLKVDNRRRKLISETEELKAQLNQISSQKPDQQQITKAKELKAKIKNSQTELDKLEEKIKGLLFSIPNLPLSDVPLGRDEKANQVIKEWGQKGVFDFEPKDYLFLGEKLDLFDLKRAAKTAGSRFGYLKREAVLLEFALVQLAIGILRGEGFIPIVPPVMLKPQAMKAMGYLDSHSDEIYHLEQDNLYLVGTSEQSIGAMHSDEIFTEQDLPKRYVGFSTCFRREAGSYGKDTKGILRVHQFDKVEMFSFCLPQDSEKEHQLLLSLEEKLVQLLEIPYRLVKICTADLSYPSAKTFDLECWLPGQGQYRETHSTSNCTDFQARRLNTRYQTKEGKTDFVHTLNGTAFAIGRMIIAILENYQKSEGRIEVPKILRKYMDNLEEIRLH